MAKYNVNPALIEEQRKKLQEQNGGNAFKPKVVFDEKNYLNDRLKDNEDSREMRIRILPLSPTDGNAFLAIHTHSLKVNKEISKSGFKSFICLNDENIDNSNHDERGCPLCKKSKELFAEADKCVDESERKALVKSAMQYKSKVTYIARVIERGHEDEGVKFWRFNAHMVSGSNGNKAEDTGIYGQLMKQNKIRNEESIEATGEPYCIFDLYNGKDIILTLTKELKGNKYVTKISVTDAGFPSPLSKDEDKIEEWVNDPKQWSDMYSSKSYEYLQLIADGEIPFFDKANKKWVAKGKTDASKTAEEVEMEARKELTDIPTNDEVNDDDLPF